MAHTSHHSLAAGSEPHRSSIFSAGYPPVVVLGRVRSASRVRSAAAVVAAVHLQLSVGHRLAAPVTAQPLGAIGGSLQRPRRWRSSRRRTLRKLRVRLGAGVPFIISAFLKVASAARTPPLHRADTCARASHQDIGTVQRPRTLDGLASLQPLHSLHSFALASAGTAPATALATVPLIPTTANCRDRIKPRAPEKQHRPRGCATARKSLRRKASPRRRHQH